MWRTLNVNAAMGNKEAPPAECINNAMPSYEPTVTAQLLRGPCYADARHGVAGDPSTFKARCSKQSTSGGKTIQATAVFVKMCLSGLNQLGSSNVPPHMPARMESVRTGGSNACRTSGRNGFSTYVRGRVSDDHRCRLRRSRLRHLLSGISVPPETRFRSDADRKCSDKSSFFPGCRRFDTGRNRKGSHLDGLPACLPSGCPHASLEFPRMSR